MEGNVAYIDNGARKKQKKTSSVKRAPQAVNKHKASSAVVIKKETKKARKGIVSTILVVFTVFCAMAVLISRYAIVSSIGSENNSLRSSISEIETRIEELKVDMEMRSSLESVMSAAENELDMTYPQQGQKVSLDMDG